MVRKYDPRSSVGALEATGFYKKKEKYQFAELTKVEKNSKNASARTALADAGLLKVLAKVLFWHVDEMLPTMTAKVKSLYSDIALLYSADAIFRTGLNQEQPFSSMVMDQFSFASMELSDLDKIGSAEQKHDSMQHMMTWVRILQHFAKDEPARSDTAVSPTFNAIFSSLATLGKAGADPVKPTLEAALYALTSVLLRTENGILIFCTVNPKQYLQHWLFALDRVRHPESCRFLTAGLMSLSCSTTGVNLMLDGMVVQAMVAVNENNKHTNENDRK
jgi:hypothetical protein